MTFKSLKLFYISNLSQTPNHEPCYVNDLWRTIGLITLHYIIRTIEKRGEERDINNATDRNGTSNTSLYSTPLYYGITNKRTPSRISTQMT